MSQDLSVTLHWTQNTLQRQSRAKLPHIWTSVILTLDTTLANTIKTYWITQKTQWTLKRHCMVKWDSSSSSPLFSHIKSQMFYVAATICSKVSQDINVTWGPVDSRSVLQNISVTVRVLWELLKDLTVRCKKYVAKQNIWCNIETER